MADATSGARIFVDQEAVPMSDDKALDVQTDDTGQFQFAITQARRRHRFHRLVHGTAKTNTADRRGGSSRMMPSGA